MEVGGNVSPSLKLLDSRSSTSSTRRPNLASVMAVAVPAGPAPIDDDVPFRTGLIVAGRRHGLLGFGRTVQRGIALVFDEHDLAAVLRKTAVFGL